MLFGLHDNGILVEESHGDPLQTLSKYTFLRYGNPVVSLLAVYGSLERKGFCQPGGRHIMKEQQLAPIGSFCLNEACKDYKRVGLSNIVRCGKTDKGVQRYRCKTCQKGFTETKGTIFYRCR